MRLLIITQVIDTNHPILGFFHRWVEEFAKHCEKVHVIALQVGEHQLPSNVVVHSLGKEKGLGKIGYLIAFYRLIWSLRGEYDSVFVHMNQQYVVLGAPLWRWSKKKIGLWYTHGSTSLSLHIAEKVTDVVFTASSESFNVNSKKVLVTGHGIDTEIFYPGDTKKDIDLITVGRISRAKNLHTLIEIVKAVRETHDVRLTILGEAITQSGQQYESELKELIKRNGLTEAVHFIGSATQAQLPGYLNRAKLFVTAANNGSLDKAMLEAMACGLPMVSMAQGSRSLPLGSCQVSSKEAFIVKINEVLELNASRVDSYRTFVEEHHSIKSLIPKIITTLS